MTQPPRKRGRPRKNPAPALTDLDDLIGAGAPAPAPKPKPAPKQKATPAPQAGERDPEDNERISIDVSEIYGGVSANWLATMFGHDKNTIKKKLAKSGIEIVGRRNGGPLYRLADAAPYLVKPEVDLVEYVKSLRPNDLPPMLNEAYWSAMLKRQKWEENAGDLWRTADVLEVLGDLNFQVRNTVNLWVEEVDRADALTQKQREMIIKKADELLHLFYKMLVELPGKRRTPASIAEDGAMPESTSSGPAEE